MANSIFRPFREGFVGAFALAGAIVLAVFSVTSAFLRGELPSKPAGSSRDFQVSRH